MRIGTFRRVLVIGLVISVLSMGCPAVVCTVSAEPPPTPPVKIGSRLELFVDDFLVEHFEGDAQLHPHKPLGKEVVLTNDQPWEDTTMGYFAVLQDGETFRMYYRGHHHGSGEQARGEPMCFAESRDGIHWVKPELGLFSFHGSAANNIVLGGDPGKFPPTDKWRGDLGFETGLGSRADMVPFLDPNADAAGGGRYKALIRGARGAHQIPGQYQDYGLYPFQSPDGIHWSRMSDRPVITKGRFDSQNLAFWDAAHGRYVAFLRDLLDGRVRDVHISVSDDFINWSEPEPLSYPGDTIREMYTNAVIPYERAPHLLIGFPTEMINRFAVQQTHPIFMSSRDGGRTFQRRGEPLIPGESPQERDGNRSNFMAQGLLRGNDREYFVYATEGYGYEKSDAVPTWTKSSFQPATRLRRFTYRFDGFVSVRAGTTGGAVVTKPLLFQGDALVVNYIAWPVGAGNLRVEVQDTHGQPLPGLSLEACEPLRGDEIDYPVTWRSHSRLGDYAGQPVRLRFQLEHADLFSFQFQHGTETP